MNNNEIFEIEKINSFNSNWNFIYGENNNNSYLDFGKRYKICTIDYPAILIINKKFKKVIEKFKKIILSENFLPTTVFEIVLKNAIIIYFDENNENKNINKYIKKYLI